MMNSINKAMKVEIIFLGRMTTGTKYWVDGKDEGLRGKDVQPCMSPPWRIQARSQPGFRVGRTGQNSVAEGTVPDRKSSRLAAHWKPNGHLTEWPFQTQWGPDTFHNHKHRAGRALFTFCRDRCVWELTMAEGEQNWCVSLLAIEKS